MFWQTTNYFLLLAMELVIFWSTFHHQKNSFLVLGREMSNILLERFCYLVLSTHCTLYTLHCAISSTKKRKVHADLERDKIYLTDSCSTPVSKQLDLDDNSV
jgi:hypothetical protein